jgi:hypothetical protein
VLHTEQVSKESSKMNSGTLLTKRDPKAWIDINRWILISIDEYEADFLFYHFELFKFDIFSINDVNQPNYGL